MDKAISSEWEPFTDQASVRVQQGIKGSETRRVSAKTVSALPLQWAYVPQH